MEQIFKEHAAPRKEAFLKGMSNLERMEEWFFKNFFSVAFQSRERGDKN